MNARQSFWEHNNTYNFLDICSYFSIVKCIIYLYKSLCILTETKNNVEHECKSAKVMAQTMNHEKRKKSFPRSKSRNEKNKSDSQNMKIIFGSGACVLERMFSAV